MNQATPRCPTCGHKIKPEWRVMTIDKSMLRSLALIYRWAKEKGQHEFLMKDVKHLMTHVQYSKLNNLVYFGGLVYRTGEKGRWYGINLERVEEFFKGTRTIPARVLKSYKTGETKPEEPINVRQVPDLARFLDEQGIYQVEYRTSPL